MCMSWNKCPHVISLIRNEITRETSGQCVETTICINIA